VNKYPAVAISLLCLCGMVVAAQAQNEGAIVVNVPFEFVAGSTTLPAGKYKVTRNSADNSLLLISDQMWHCREHTQPISCTRRTVAAQHQWM